MDITTLLGIIIGMALIIRGIGLQYLGNFWDPASIIIVLGGTLAALFASYPLKTFMTMPTHLKILIGKPKYDPMKYINVIVEFAMLARKNGLLALEEKASEEKEPFMKESILLIVDAIDPDKVREMLEGDLAYLTERHNEGIGIYEKGSALAPAFGMIGTLIGLVNMLKGMDMATGSSSIGDDMSVALITTFYGTMLSNLFFAPIAKKLRVRHNEEILCKEIIIEGVLSIQSGENPKFIKEKLISFLSQKQRAKALKDEAAGKGAAAEEK